MAWGNNNFGQATVPYYTVAVNPSGTVPSGQSAAITANAGGLNGSWGGATSSGCTSGNIIKTTRVELTAVLPPGVVVSWKAGCSSTTATTCTLDSLTDNTTIDVRFGARGMPWLPLLLD